MEMSKISIAKSKRTRRVKTAIINLISIYVLLIIVTCKKEDVATEVRTGVPVAMNIASLRTFTNAITRPGSVTVQDKVAITVPREEVITSIKVREGDSVKRGQLLCTLDVGDLMIEAQRAKSEIGEAREAAKMAEIRFGQTEQQTEKELLSIEKEIEEIAVLSLNLTNTKRILSNKLALYKESGITQEELIQLQMNYINEIKNLELRKKEHQIRLIGFRDEDILKAGIPLPQSDDGRRAAFLTLHGQMALAEKIAAEARLSNAELRSKTIESLISKSTIYSPIDGVVAVRNFDTGERGDRTKPILILVNSGSVFIEVDVPENQMIHISVGDILVSKSDLFPTLSFTNRVSIISPILDPQTRSLNIKATLRNTKSNPLRPGMYVQTTLYGSKPFQALSVPKGFLVDESDSEAWVYVAENGKAKRRKVTILKRLEDWVCLDSGVTVGETLLRSLSGELSEGDEIEISKMASL